MAKARIRTRTKTNPAFRNLSKQLKEAGRGDLRKKAKAAIVAEGAPAVAALRAATMGVQVRVTEVANYNKQETFRGSRPAARRRSTGLRARVAGAIGTQVLVSGIRIKVNGRRVLPGKPAIDGDNLARYLIAASGRKKRWRHPVFSETFEDSPVIVMQQGEDIWFTTLKPHLKRFRKGVQKVIDDTVKELGG